MVKVLDIKLTDVNIDIETRVPGERPRKITTFKALMEYRQKFERDPRDIGGREWQAVNSQIEVAIGQLFGSPLIPVTRGLRGLQADVRVDPASARAVAESISTQKTKVIDSFLERTDTEVAVGATGPVISEIKAMTGVSAGAAPQLKKNIKIAGEAEGFKLERGKGGEFLTATGETAIIPPETLDPLINQLAASMTKTDITNVIESNSTLLSNIISKSGRILIPYKGLDKQAKLKALIFNWRQMKQFANFKVNVSGDSIRVQITYPKTFVSRLMNITKQGTKMYTDKLGTKNAFELLVTGNILNKARPYINIEYLEGSILVGRVNNFLTGSALAAAIQGKKRKRPLRKQPTRGKFISNVQLSAILRQKLTEIMPRYPEPQRPTPRYITGKLANSFRVMANYRTGVMAFYNTPPASEYVDQLNSDGWMLDETLVEPTIRQITQERFGRQFRVLRTQ
jgi:hypothetical protein